jgi:uncharacterized protein YndB with AHSA1/START domain
LPDVRWRLRLASPPDAVYELLATDAGRARFWAESAVERDGAIEWSFASGLTERGEILEREPGRVFAVRYFGETSRFELAPLDGGTDLMLTDTGAEHAGWVSVLLALKAAADFGVDLRNHDPQRTWEQGYCDN